jgi:hypothetical protein
MSVFSQENTDQRRIFLYNNSSCRIGSDQREISLIAMSSEGGFDFSLCKRNAMLELKGCHGPKAWKTGTTIAGVVYKVCIRSENLLSSYRTEML